jgi:hypothetical protein
VSLQGAQWWHQNLMMQLDKLLPPQSNNAGTGLRILPIDELMKEQLLPGLIPGFSEGVVMIRNRTRPPPPYYYLRA